MSRVSESGLGHQKRFGLCLKPWWASTELFRFKSALEAATVCATCERPVLCKTLKP